MEQIDNPDRRDTDRWRISAALNVNLALVMGGQHVVPEAVADVTAKGASLRFAASAQRMFVAGDEVTVAISAAEADLDAEWPARIIFVGNAGVDQFVGLSFREVPELDEPGGVNLVNLFGSCGVRKVEDDARTSPAFGQILPDDEQEARTSIPARIQNISICGIGLAVYHRADQFVRGRAQICLEIQLTGQGAPRVLVLKPCHRVSGNDFIYYGCEIDWDATREIDAIGAKAYARPEFERDLSAISH